MTRVVLAYSGGLDTSICIHWLQVNRGMKTVAFAANIGQEKDPAPLRERALRTGAEGIHILDLREEFVRDYIFPALKANALYENGYPLHTALSRPLIAKGLVQVAAKENIGVVAHGCTGKGNDQVRIEGGVSALAPHLKIIAPVREWEFRSREEEIDYAIKHEIKIPVTREKPYSIDHNLWGVSIECGELEDPWNAPPKGAYQITADPMEAPNEPAEVTIGFEAGVPVSLDGKSCGGVDLIQRLTELGGAHGVGRIDIVENRVVGIKSREIYEAPAAVLLIAAHRAVEELVFSKNLADLKDSMGRQYANMIYSGLWFTDLRLALDAFINETQRYVCGEARLRLFKGAFAVVGRRSPYSLYDKRLATYGEGDTFDHKAAAGFLSIYGLAGRAEGIRRNKTRTGKAAK